MTFTYTYYRSFLEELIKTHKPLTYNQIAGHKGPSFLLRHDIDYGLEFLGEIPEIENELGISATYFLQTSSEFYNIFSNTQASCVQRLKELGHRIGLHTDSTSRVPKSEINHFIELEKSVLEHVVKPIDAVSFHQPPDYIIKNEVKINYINTYDLDDMRGFIYMSDSRGRWSKGDPIKFVKENIDASFQILVHPITWGSAHKTFKERAEGSIVTKANMLHDYLSEHCCDISKRNGSIWN